MATRRKSMSFGRIPSPAVFAKDVAAWRNEDGEPVMPFSISFRPTGRGGAAIIAAFNQGIDSYLEAIEFTQRTDS